MYDLIVIGAGPGGYEAAAQAGKMKKKVILFDKQYIGGTCLNVGCIPTKTLLKSAHVYNECKEAGLYGVTTTAPGFNMTKVQARKQKVISMLTKGVEGMLQRSKVEIVKAAATIAGKGMVEADGKKYEAANILIATGSAPAVPSIKGIESKDVLDSTSILEIKIIPASLVIIGGGVIGLEFASFFADIGTRVTVVEMLPHIAPGLDIDVTKRLQRELEKKKVKFNLACAVEEIKNKMVSYQDATGKKYFVEGEYILNATGRCPVTEGLGLENVGVHTNRGSIVTSDEGRTNVPGIWACGDVTGRCLLAHAATREGLVAVNNMFGKPDAMSYVAIPSVVYTNPEVACVGKTEAQCKKEEIDYVVSTMPMAIAGRFMVENEGKTGMVKVIVGKQHGELLGVHMIGGPCSEILQGAVTMIECELRVEDIKDVVFPHPTISEALKETCIQAL
ncbi:MAG: dihydrolipoyl dehydrogenase [Fibrobacteria bacterium]|nr:dihydrolipoyl dehydrogenase [Fibrobacteria bacterium]